MTQIGEGVAAGGGKDPNKPDLEENHWLELEYRYQSGAPIYGTYEAIDSEGMIWTGRLNDEGQVCLAGLPAGNVQVSLLPEENTDTELEETRNAIKAVLDQIVADQRAEAEEYERELEQMGGARRAFTHIHSFGKGLWNGAIGVVEFVGDTAYKVIQIADYLGPINQLGNVLKAGYQSYQSGELTWDEWYDSVNENLQNEHKKDIARLLGVEPDDLSEERLRQLMQMVAEAYDIAAFIADDQATQDILKQFAEDMADAQHSVEWAEFAGAGVFEIVLGALLAIFTGGAGNVAQAASKLRHAARLRNLGHLFRKLARLLRRKKLNKGVDAPVDQRTATNTDQPEAIELRPSGSVTIPPGRGSTVKMDGHKIYDPAHPPLSSNPAAQYRFSDPTYRSTGGDVYFGENIATSYYEVRKKVTGKSLFVGDVEVENVLDLTDPDVVREFGIDPSRLSERMDSPLQQSSVYGYTNEISNKAYDAGYSGIVYPSSRKQGNNTAVVLFEGRYDPSAIEVIIDAPIK